MQYRDRHRKRSGKSVNNEGHELEDITPKKKGKVARVYGVDNHKYYECPTDRGSIELLKHIGSIASFSLIETSLVDTSIFFGASK